MQKDRALQWFLAACGLAAAQRSSFGQELIGEINSVYAIGDPVRSAGDLNGDGRVEIIVCARSANGNSGWVAVYDGASLAQLWQGNGNHGWAFFGSSADQLGDVNADGYRDILIGATHQNNGSGQDAGAVYIVSGRAIVTGSGLQYLATLYGAAANDEFGTSVTLVEDLDADGVTDLAVGAPREDHGGLADAGSVRVYSGRTRASLWTKWGTAIDERFGTQVDTCGDVNGDGKADLVVGAPGNNDNGDEAGVVYFLSGADGSEIFRVYEGSAGDHLGAVLSSRGDANDDGFCDLLTGIPESNWTAPDAGRAVLFSGQTGDPLGAFVGSNANDTLGASVCLGGDLNGDGHADLLVAAPLEEAGATNNGRVRVISGATLGVMGTIDGWQQNYIDLGRYVTVLGRIDADSLPDLAITSPNTGRVRIYSGASYSCYVYCVGAPNSVGSGASIGWEGSVSVAQDDFTLTCDGLPAQGTGLFYYGPNQVQVPFGNGFRCVGGFLRRLRPINWQGGHAEDRLDLAGEGIVPGSSWNFQFWYRDVAGGGSLFNLSNAMNATFLP